MLCRFRFSVILSHLESYIRLRNTLYGFKIRFCLLKWQITWPCHDIKYSNNLFSNANLLKIFRGPKIVVITLLYLKPYLEVQLGRESHRSPIDWRDRTIRPRSQDLSKAFSWDYPLSYSFDGFYMKLLAHTFLEYFLLQFMNTKVNFK